MSMTTREPRNALAEMAEKSTTTKATRGTQANEAATGRDALLGQVAQRLMLVQRVVKLAAKQLMAEHDLSPEVARIGAGQYYALSELAKVDRLMAGELADRCHVSEPTVSKMLKSLEASGFIERQTDPANRRVVWVRLTPAGLAVREKMMSHFEGALARVLDGLDDGQLTDLLAGLGHLEHLVADAEGKHEARPDARQ